jgi:3-oxoacyl-[acyl-carrier-protein] synthase-3
MAPAPQLWGWGTVHQTERDLAELAVASGERTLAGAGLDPAAVDALLLCCTRFPGGPETHGDFVAGIMAGLGLPGAAVFGLTLNRCVNALAAIHLATALATSGCYRNILVVTTDKISGDEPRLEQFALFSDGAASCLVSATVPAGPAYEVVGTASAQRNADLGWTNEVSSDLTRQVNDALLKPSGLALEQVEALLHANLVIPLLTMKERQAGFSPRQLNTGLAARVGHCFAADPLIALAEREAAAAVRDGAYYMLATSVPGARYGVLLRASGQ